MRAARLGFDLLLWARSEPELRSAADQAASHGVDVRIGLVDVSDAAAVSSAGASSLGDAGSLRGVVVNAGGGTWTALTDLTSEEWRSTVAVNLDGAFHTIQLALPLLLRHHQAQIVGVASDSSYFPFAGRAAYCASKAGFLSLLNTTREELRAHGVRVTAVVPSRVDTYFRGQRPGSRPDALSADDVADVVGSVLLAPPRIELREIQLSAVASPFGPFG